MFLLLFTNKTFIIRYLDHKKFRKNVCARSLTSEKHSFNNGFYTIGELLESF